MPRGGTAGDGELGGELLTAAIAGAESPAALRHVAELPARSARPAGWPDWAEPGVVRAFVDHGVETPWSHQVAAADPPTPGSTW